MAVHAYSLLYSSPTLSLYGCGIGSRLSIIIDKTIKKEDEGFYYLDNIGISVQRAESNKCVCEIINQCIENEIELSMKIKLINDITINISF